MKAYPHAIVQLQKDFHEAAGGNVRNHVLDLAKRLIQGGMAMDIARLETLGVESRFGGIKRSCNHPPYFEHPSIIGAPWADDPQNPLVAGERWNEGDRATNTGIRYGFDAQGYPRNPYMNTGLDGRGVLGKFGPNHAIDNGLMMFHKDEQGMTRLYTRVILRKHDNNAPAFAGGFVKSSGGVGSSTHEDILQSRTEEFFEEMVSGSIDLLPYYREQIEKRYTEETGSRKSRGGVISSEHAQEIREQIETQLKMEQVRDIDPEFMARLRQIVGQGHECYAGPVLNSNRVTNQAWIETRLSWVLLDEPIWDYIRSDNPPFDYQFKAGDDASDVRIIKLDSSFLKQSFESHSAMFAFMAASLLLEKEMHGESIPESVMEQLESTAVWLETFPVSNPVQKAMAAFDRPNFA